MAATVPGSAATSCVTRRATTRRLVILHSLDHVFTLRKIAGDVIGALRGLQFELADQLLGVLANQVEGDAEPLVNRSIQQDHRQR